MGNSIREVLEAKMNMLLKKREEKKKAYKSELFEIEVELLLTNLWQISIAVFVATQK